MSHFVTAALFAVSIAHTIAGISRGYLHFFLVTIRVLLFGAFSVNVHPVANATFSIAQDVMMNAFKTDIRTILRRLSLEPDIVLYASCASCFATYEPDKKNTHDPYPHVCTHSEMGQPVCGTPLVYAIKERPDDGPPRLIYKAIKVFPYRSIKAYLATLLLRHGVEGHLEKCVEAIANDQTWHDIIEAPAIRTFRGPDGRNRFSVQVNGELRLVFSVFIDWFNPYGNKRAGKSHSIGGIYLACLNLPPHLRFRPEYIYLAGIIPGPKEPSLEQVNHFLKPLVDELLQLWHAGVYVPVTAQRSMGRLVRAAVIPLVCDLPALRKAAGFGGHAATFFCSYCLLPKKDMNNADRSSWPCGRSWAQHLQLAKDWRDATSPAVRNRVWKQHGLRWSELLRLPYWDPTRYAVIDTMHNLFLGELRHHCMEVWGIGGVDEEKDVARNSLPHTPEQQAVQFDRVLEALKAQSSTALLKIWRDYLAAVAELNGAVERKSHATKQQISDALLALVCRYLSVICDL